MVGSRVGAERMGAMRSTGSARYYYLATPTLTRTIKVIYLVYPPLLIVNIKPHVCRDIRHCINSKSFLYSIINNLNSSKVFLEICLTLSGEILNFLESSTKVETSSIFVLSNIFLSRSGSLFKKVCFNFFV